MLKTMGKKKKLRAAKKAGAEAKKALDEAVKAQYGVERAVRVDEARAEKGNPAHGMKWRLALTEEAKEKVKEVWPKAVAAAEAEAAVAMAKEGLHQAKEESLERMGATVRAEQSDLKENLVRQKSSRNLLNEIKPVGIGGRKSRRRRRRRKSAKKTKKRRRRRRRRTKRRKTAKKSRRRRRRRRK